jgi:cysteine-rich repeat protein
MRAPWSWAAVLAALAVVAGATAFLVPQRGPSAALRRWVGLGATCGDGRVEGREECDDGNDRSDDACLPSCQIARCGDGVVRRNVEECDDGNRAEGDGCTSACLRCPSGPSTFSFGANGHCYWREDQPRDFEDAAERCAQQDGHLVTIGDDREWREVTERLLGGGDAPAVWIGLRKQDRNGVRDFGWVDGARVLTVHWSIQEPRRTPGGLDCGVQGAGGTWAAASCGEPRAFVCERPAWVVEPHTGNAYRLFAERVTWERAREVCAARGSHLVTFSDVGEQAFVTARFPGAIWIGSHMGEREGFVWLTGEEARFSDFAPGEPNYLTEQKCVALDVDRRWWNRECEDRYSFVCETP